MIFNLVLPECQTVWLQLWDIRNWQTLTGCRRACATWRRREKDVRHSADTTCALTDHLNSDGFCMTNRGAALNVIMYLLFDINPIFGDLGLFESFKEFWVTSLKYTQTDSQTDSLNAASGDSFKTFEWVCGSGCTVREIQTSSSHQAMPVTSAAPRASDNSTEVALHSRTAAY